MTAFRSTALVLAALLASVSTNQAAEQSYLAAIVKNNTNIRITYQYKHNNGAWYTVSLNPGAKHVYSVPYPSGNHTIYIRHDNRLNDNQVTLTNTTLAMYATTNPNYGWQQNFIRVNDGNTLVLQR